MYIYFDNGIDSLCTRSQSSAISFEIARIKIARQRADGHTFLYAQAGQLEIRSEL